MKKFAVWSFILILALFAYGGAGAGIASAFSVHTASVSASSDIVDYAERPMLTAETEMALLENVNLFGTIGVDLEMTNFTANNKSDRIVYDMELFVQPRQWLRIGVGQTRSWTDTYNTDNRLRLRVGKLF